MCERQRELLQTESLPHQSRKHERLALSVAGHRCQNLAESFVGSAASKSEPSMIKTTNKLTITKKDNHESTITNHTTSSRLVQGWSQMSQLAPRRRVNSEFVIEDENPWWNLSPVPRFCAMAVTSRHVSVKRLLTNCIRFEPSFVANLNSNSAMLNHS